MVASYVQALLQKNGIHWNDGGRVGNKNDMGQGATVTYSFMNSRPANFDSNHYRDFTPFSVTQRNQVRHALRHYEDVANIRFQERTTGGTLQIGYANVFFDFNGDGNFSPAGGLATRPRSSGSSIVMTRNRQNFAPGSTGHTIVLHELGHAVGGFNDVTVARNSNGKYTSGHAARNIGMNGRLLSSWQDNRKYTVMSYNDHPDMPGVQPRTLMPYDIAAIQALYGANWNHNAGNNNYFWGRNETFVETIWDGRGIDTINASNQTRQSFIDLRAGHFSSIGSYHNTRNAKNNLAIAYGATIENARGGSGGDTIIGNHVRNILIGNAGNDYINGGGGDDYMDGGTGIDTVDYRYWNGGGQYNLAAGVASFKGFYNEEIRNFENIKTGAGRDIVIGSTVSNYIETGAGNDWIAAGAGNDYVIGGGGDDYMNGGAGIDTVDYRYWNGGGQYNLAAGIASFKGFYNEEIYNFENIKTGAGRDIVIGSTVGNYIETGAGNDWIAAGAGNDYVIGGGGDDYMNGGAGIDTVDYRYWNGGGQYNLNTGIASFKGFYNEEIRNFENIKTGAGRDIVIGNAVRNHIETGAGNDWVYAGAGNDYVISGSGHDILLGGAGNDRLVGSTGNDLLLGHTGQDILSGGTGIDRFRFNSFREGADRITDFVRTQGDKIEIVANGFGGGLAKGLLNAGQFVLGAVSDANDRFIYNRSNGALSFDIDGSGARTAVHFATLSPGTTLTSNDIVVI